MYFNSSYNVYYFNLHIMHLIFGLCRETFLYRTSFYDITQLCCTFLPIMHFVIVEKVKVKKKNVTCGISERAFMLQYELSVKYNLC